MITNDIVNALVKEAESSSVANSVFHVLALRKRARSSISLISLMNKMRQEGFNYRKDDYLPIFRLLAKLGLGELNTGPRGGIKGIKNIKYTLQSIGAIACKQGNTAEDYKPRNKFAEIQWNKPKVIKELNKAKEVVKHKSNSLNLELDLNGTLIHIPVPRGLTTNQIAQLVDRLKSA